MPAQVTNSEQPAAQSVSAPSSTQTPVVQPASAITKAALPSELAEDEQRISRLLAGKPAKDWKMDWGVVVICALLGVIILLAAAVNRAVGLTFKADLGSSILGLLGSLLIVSLFVERVIEVFVSVWADREAARHEQNRDYWQARQRRLERDVESLVAELAGSPAPDAARKAIIDQLLQDKRGSINEAANSVDTAERALLPFRARARKATAWVGLVVGLFTSAVGFRFLQQLVDLSSIYDPSMKLVSPQFGWFVAADVLLTGAVLAGGSKLVHEIFSVYESFMGSARKSVAGKGQ
jgi:hypothetical protein